MKKIATNILITTLFFCSGIQSLMMAKDIKKESSSKNLDDDVFTWLGTFSEVCSIVRDRPFRTVDIATAFKASLKSFVATLDPHSTFFPPESYKAALDSASGNFSGIGVSIISKAPEDEALAVINVIDGGPAEKAGLQARDKIVEVEGTKLRGLATEEVITKLKGKIGSTVTIKVIRDDKTPHEFTITRDIIKDQTSLGYYFPDHNTY